MTMGDQSDRGGLTGLQTGPQPLLMLRRGCSVGIVVGSSLDSGQMPCIGEGSGGGAPQRYRHLYASFQDLRPVERADSGGAGMSLWERR
jgi:hypothetical protein